MDVWAAAAREHHRKAMDASAAAAVHREARNQIILRLHRDGWGYKRIAAGIGCSRDTVRIVIAAAEPPRSSG